MIYKNPISLAFFRLLRRMPRLQRLLTVGPRWETWSRRWLLRLVTGALYPVRKLWPSSPPWQVNSGKPGLLQVRGADASARGRRLRNLKKSRRFEMAVAHMLFFRKSLFDPDGLLAQMLHRVGWISGRVS